MRTEIDLASAYRSLILGVICVSTGSLFARLAQGPPTLLAAMRCTVAALVLWAVLRPDPRPLRDLPRGAQAGLAFAGVALAAHLGLWIASLYQTSVAASVLLVNTTPVWVLLFSFILRIDRPTLPTLIATAGCLTGCAVLALGEDQTGTRLMGSLLALGGGAAMGAYLVATRRLSPLVPFALRTATAYSIAGVVLVGVLVAEGTPGPISASMLGWGMAMTLCAQVLGHSFVNHALDRLPAPVVSVAMLGEPVLATLLALVVLREVPSPTFWWGATVILASLAFLALRSPPQTVEA